MENSPIGQNPRQQKESTKGQSVRGNHPLQVRTRLIEFFLNRRQSHVRTRHEDIVEELRARSDQQNQGSPPGSQPTKLWPLL